jgi:hypothetical protein
MRVTLEQFMNKIGVEIALRPYETIPFDYFNPEKGVDIMAEISLSGDGTLINAEIQQIQHGPNDTMIHKQIVQLQLGREPQGTYFANQMAYNGSIISGKHRNWFEGGCRFLKQTISLLKKGTAPDFEAIYKATLDEPPAGDASGGGGGGRALKGDKMYKPPMGGRGGT